MDPPDCLIAEEEEVDSPKAGSGRGDPGAWTATEKTEAAEGEGGLNSAVRGSSCGGTVAARRRRGMNT